MGNDQEKESRKTEIFAKQSSQIHKPKNEFSPIPIPSLMFQSRAGCGGNANEIIKTFPCFFNF